MGDLAASGGYYIVAAADTIVASPNTITGSIGVFGLLVNASDFFRNKLGVTTDVENTNAYSDFASIYRPLSLTEQMTLQKMIDETYSTFVTRVSDGRKLSFASVDNIAEGRVWSGSNAKDRGLVDIMGGLSTSIEIAAKKAKLDVYKIVELPRQEDALTQLMNQLADVASEKILKNELGDKYKYYRYMKHFLGNDRIQTRLPFEITVQ
jgi:protease-4